ncbi:MAG: helix-turn-helix domain-containing protein [Pseudomonadota bacterium]
MRNSRRIYLYSSYGAYVSKSKQDIVHRDLIWGMTATRGENAPRKYKEFVERAIGREDLESPLKNVYGGMVLGGVGFVKGVLSRLKEDELSRKDVSHRRALKAAYDVEAVIDALCTYFNTPRENLLSDKKGEQRNIALYLLKKYTGITNEEIGSLFGGISYSAVAKAYSRFSAKLASDRKLKQRVSGILSNVKGDPWRTSEFAKMKDLKKFRELVN